MVAWVYILTNKPHGVLYVGVTSDLKGRMAKHKTKFYPNSFTARYNADRLVYYERIDGMMNAIKREKQIKVGNRARKVKYIEAMNPEWKDLTPELVKYPGRIYRSNVMVPRSVVACPSRKITRAT